LVKHDIITLAGQYPISLLGKNIFLGNPESLRAGMEVLDVLADLGKFSTKVPHEIP